MKDQMIRVISSPSSSTTGFSTLIFAMAVWLSLSSRPTASYGGCRASVRDRAPGPVPRMAIPCFLPGVRAYRGRGWSAVSQCLDIKLIPRLRRELRRHPCEHDEQARHAGQDEQIDPATPNREHADPPLRQEQPEGRGEEQRTGDDGRSKIGRAHV